MLDWSKQGFVFLAAALLSFYWTARNGFWDALTGAADKEWKEAHQLLVKKVAGKGYVILDGINSLGSKRMVIINERRPEQATQAPLVAAEVFPIMKYAPRGRRENFRRQNTKRGRHAARELQKEAVARIHIHDPKLEFLRETFRKDKRGFAKPGYNLIEVHTESEVQIPQSSNPNLKKRTAAHSEPLKQSRSVQENSRTRPVDDSGIVRMASNGNDIEGHSVSEVTTDGGKSGSQDVHQKADARIQSHEDTGAANIITSEKKQGSMVKQKQTPNKQKHQNEL